jgi:hypothetical protein
MLSSEGFELMSWMQFKSARRLISENPDPATITQDDVILTRMNRSHQPQQQLTDINDKVHQVQHQASVIH